MQQGDNVQAKRPVIGGRKNVYANASELLTIINVDFLPVLIVTKYGCANKFPVHVDSVSIELHPKYKAHIKEDKAKKTVTKWQ